MRYIYHAKLRPTPDGGYVVRFPDVPEAITAGDTLNEALAMAEDALAVALLGRIEAGEPLPHPRQPGADENLHPVAVPAPVAAKLALIQLWRQSGLSKSALARRMGVDEKVVRRLLDPNHNSSLTRLDEAIQALGGKLIISTDFPDAA